MYTAMVNSYRFVRDLIYLPFANFQEYCVLKLKEKRIINNPYDKLKKFKDLYRGKRCFIIATGPSLTVDDIEMLGDEYTFGMNSLVTVLDKISFTPTFYGIQDGVVYEKLREKIKSSSLKNVFVADGKRTYMKKEFFKDGDWITFPYNAVYHLFSMEYLKRTKTIFSNDASLVVYDGATITYSLIQIAIYMGFTEIYLIGVDCNYQKGIKNFADHGLRPNDTDGMRERMINAYLVAKEYGDNNGVEIYNATRGGTLEVFPRVNLESVLERS